MEDEMRKSLCMGGNDCNPLCPRCDQIVKYSCEDSVTEFCRRCGYDLKRPISKIRNFFHELFWGWDRHKYPLARYYSEGISEDEFKVMMKGLTNAKGD